MLEPFGTFERIAHLRARTGLEIEMHAHDDLGLATANTLAACKAGATHANTTVNGLASGPATPRWKKSWWASRSSTASAPTST
jgi:isopropylmalate/homocitrate/citramalate synthase